MFKKLIFSHLRGSDQTHDRLGIIKSTSFREILEEKERPMNRKCGLNGLLPLHLLN